MTAIWQLIDPRVVIRAHSAPKGAAGRFVELIRAVWSRLPPAVRDDFAKRWQSSEDGSPNFILTDDLEDHANGIGTYGVYSAPSRFAFSAAKIGRMRDSLAEALIAHELAHCFLRHVGNEYSTQDEDAADGLVESWGFPIGELNLEIRLPDTATLPSP